jgi:hypothetical protein
MLKDNEVVRNCSEYVDPYGNITIETHKYIYKISRINGRVFRKQKSNKNRYFMITSDIDKKNFPKNRLSVSFNPITGKCLFLKK